MRVLLVSPSDTPGRAHTYQCAGLLRGSVADDHGHADDRDGDHEEAQTEQN